MSRTYRNPTGILNRWFRSPRYKHKLLDDTISRKEVVSDWEDKPYAAFREVRRGNIKNVGFWVSEWFFMKAHVECLIVLRLRSLLELAEHSLGPFASQALQ